MSCSNNSKLICMGSVNASTNGSLYLTKENQDEINQIGRVLYRQPGLAWPASFSTAFTVVIETQYPNSSRSGDGMSFIIAQDDKPSPSESYGSYMGILDASTQGGFLRQLAVELDTYKNEDEPDGNHIAIDTISVKNSLAIKSLNSFGINLKSGKEITINIIYEGWNKSLQIYAAYNGNALSLILNQTIIMQNTVPNRVYLGFTASTGFVSETHRVLSWNFTSTKLPKESLYTDRGNGKGNRTKLVLIVVVPILVGFLVLGILVGPFVYRVIRRKNERSGRQEDMEMLTRNAANTPTIYSYKKLLKATHKFNKENLLGSGGFGSVYKGILFDPPTTIAVKKISANSSQGEREYLAEICTIGRLRHKNLLQLQGWCHDRDQLLLVYEYMPNGSLDRFIGRAFLDWRTRYNILTGLASVLVYLHEECDNPVVHRDVKPNNVMLDSNYNAHLGDFGLARLLQNDTSVTTMVAGTPGYLAPEVSYTGRATPESDVYSFGMVVLEVVCGKRSKGMMEENSLVDFVWSLYEKGELLKCVDQMLEGEFYEEQARRSLIVGLACLHPDYMLRPRMRKIVQIFMNPEEPLMKLPESRPSAIYVSLYSSSNSNTTNFGSNKTPATIGSMESLPDEISVSYVA
ncbi:hypothetical protein LguiA_036477 [Lonicera macranthoides]